MVILALIYVLIARLNFSKSGGHLCRCFFGRARNALFKLNDEYETQRIVTLAMITSRGAPMQDDLRQLYDIEARLNDAAAHLREQQNIVAELHSTLAGAALIKLLSSGLRNFSWLERERENLGQKFLRPKSHEMLKEVGATGI